MTNMLEVLGYGLMMIASAAFWIWWQERKERKQAEARLDEEHKKQERKR